MPDRPPIDEPALLERLAMDDREFGEYARGLVAAMPTRAYDDEALTRALGYPWARPVGSYRLAGDRVDRLGDMAPAEREAAIAAYTSGDGRTPLLAIGSNGSPETLERKFAHFDIAEDRELLVLSGRLHDFDIGFAAQPALYGSMPATLFPSPGTAVGVAVLWVTPAQLTQLAWSELSYRLGWLRARFDVDEGGATFDETLAFVSRFGAFRVGGERVALAAVPAEGRRSPELSQEEALDAAAALAIGPGACAEALVRAIHEDLPATFPKLAERVNGESVPFESECWAPLYQSR